MTTSRTDSEPCTRASRYRPPVFSFSSESVCVSEGRTYYQANPAADAKTLESIEDDPLPVIPELDTRGLFLLMKKYARFGNCARYGFLVGLKRVCEGELYRELSCSSPRQFLVAEFGMTRSSSFSA